MYDCRAEPAVVLGKGNKDVEAAEAFGIVASAEQHPAEAAMVSGPALAEAIVLAKALPADMQRVSEEQPQELVDPDAALCSTAEIPQTDVTPAAPSAVMQSIAETKITQTSVVIADNGGTAAVHLAAAASSAAVTAVDATGEVVSVAARSEAVAATASIAVTDSTLGTPDSDPSTADAAKHDDVAVRSASNLQASGHEQGSAAMADTVSESTAGPGTVGETGAAIASTGKDQEAGSSADATYLLPATKVSLNDSDMNSNSSNTNDANRPVAQPSTLRSIHTSLRRTGTSTGAD